MTTMSPLVGIDGELHVAATGLDADSADAGEGGIAHGLVFDVGEGLSRSDGDGVAGVDPHRVEVLDRADDHAVVRVIAHDLELVFLPPRDRRLDEDLADRTRLEPERRHPFELLGGGRDAGALATEDVGRTDDDRQPDLFDGLTRLVHVVCDGRRRDRQADLDHGDLEVLTVLGGGDGLAIGPDELRRAGNPDRRRARPAPWPG